MSFASKRPTSTFGSVPSTPVASETGSGRRGETEPHTPPERFHIDPMSPSEIRSPASLRSPTTRMMQLQSTLRSLQDTMQTEKKQSKDVYGERLEVIERKLGDLRSDILAEKEVRKTALDALETKLMEEISRVEKTVREEIRQHNTGMQSIMTRLSILEQSMGDEKQLREKSIESVRETFDATMTRTRVGDETFRKRTKVEMDQIQEVFEKEVGRMAERMSALSKRVDEMEGLSQKRDVEARSKTVVRPEHIDELTAQVKQIETLIGRERAARLDQHAMVLKKTGEDIERLQSALERSRLAKDTENAAVKELMERRVMALSEEMLASHKKLESFAMEEMLTLRQKIELEAKEREQGEDEIVQSLSDSIISIQKSIVELQK